MIEVEIFLILGDFRFEYEYEIDYENDFSILVCRLHIVTHIPISSNELPSLPKTSMKSEGSGNVTGLKFKTRTRTQSRTRSPI